MSHNDPILLCDFGGTHGRLGLLKNGEILHMKKYRLADFEEHLSLFEYYQEEMDIEFKEIAIAAAEAHSEVHYSSGFQSNSKISQDYISQGGYKLKIFLNDFIASAWGVTQSNVGQISLKEGRTFADKKIKCFTGPGTGIGCAFLVPSSDGGYNILSGSHAAHIRPCFVTEEQRDIIEAIQSTLSRAVIYEDIACGRGLEKLYHIFTEETLIEPSVILDNPEDSLHAHILRLFHEFLGLYLQNTIVPVQAYGGVTLHGGLLDALYERDLFDFKTVNEMMCQPYVDIVAESLTDTPVTYINDTYLALHGLKNYLERGLHG